MNGILDRSTFIEHTKNTYLKLIDLSLIVEYENHVMKNLQKQNKLVRKT